MVIYNYSLPSANTSDAQIRLDEEAPAYGFYYYRNEAYENEWFQLPKNVQCVATSQ